MMPTVSIIIPCYKSEKYIRECLDSVINQTFTSWEAIVVDDKPSKEMIDIMSDYTKRDLRIKYYVWWRKTSPAHARNRGIEYSKGMFVAFLDADDLWMPDKLELMVNCFHEHPDIMWCAHYLIQKFPSHEKREQVYPGHSMSIGGVGATVIKMNLLGYIKRERGRVFDETLDRNDDAELILHIRNYPSVLVQQHLSYMRMRDDGLTAATSGWDLIRIIYRIGLRNHAYGLVAFQTVVFLLHSVGIDPVKIKKEICNA